MAVIHQYRNNGYKYCNGCDKPGAVHVVDDLCYARVIESLNEPGKDYTKEELLEPSVLDGVLKSSAECIQNQRFGMHFLTLWS